MDEEGKRRRWTGHVQRLHEKQLVRWERAHAGGSNREKDIRALQVRWRQQQSRYAEDRYFYGLDGRLCGMEQTGANSQGPPRDDDNDDNESVCQKSTSFYPNNTATMQVWKNNMKINHSVNWTRYYRQRYTLLIQTIMDKRKAKKEKQKLGKWKITTPLELTWKSCYFFLCFLFGWIVKNSLANSPKHCTYFFKLF